MVAPHDGCVDWNFKHILYITDTNLSHPTMGAWIEIFDIFLCPPNLFNVAPHDGCVDWNCVPLWYICIFCGRTPRWVRGLKWRVLVALNLLFLVAPHDGCVDWNLFQVFLWLPFHRRTPRWVRGLKFSINHFLPPQMCRTPRWVRGLKLWETVELSTNTHVAPHDGCVDWNYRG